MFTILGVFLVTARVGYPGDAGRLRPHPERGIVEPQVRALRACRPAAPRGFGLDRRGRRARPAGSVGARRRDIAPRAPRWACRRGGGRTPHRPRGRSPRPELSRDARRPRRAAPAVPDRPEPPACRARARRRHTRARAQPPPGRLLRHGVSPHSAPRGATRPHRAPLRGARRAALRIPWALVHLSGRGAGAGGRRRRDARARRHGAPRLRSEPRGATRGPRRRDDHGLLADLRDPDGHTVGRRRPGRPSLFAAQPGSDRRRARRAPQSRERPARSFRDELGRPRAPRARGDGCARRRSAGRLLSPREASRGRARRDDRRPRHTRVLGGHRRELRAHASAHRRRPRAPRRAAGRGAQRRRGPGHLGRRERVDRARPAHGRGIGHRTRNAAGTRGVADMSPALHEDELRKIDAYWRAANYLSVGQIYLLANPLLREPLRFEHVKPRLLGHWGTTPGLNFLYAHVNRAIKERDLDAIFVTGPGHGGPGLVANAYLEGTYSEVYTNVSADERGMRLLFRQFSFPGGIPSHVAPETPGSIHEGGELGYALSHAFGAAFDNPNLLVVCVVGD